MKASCSFDYAVCVDPLRRMVFFNLPQTQTELTRSVKEIQKETFSDSLYNGIRSKAIKR